MKPELWTSAMSVGIHDLDQDHKWILETISELFVAIKEGDSKEDIINLLGDLENYAGNHFPKEQRLMVEYDFPGMGDHMLQHAYFDHIMQEFKKKASVGDLTLDKEVQIFLSNWFVKHILAVDKKYAAFLKKKKIIL
jgi:hemerythrin